MKVTTAVPSVQLQTFKKLWSAALQHHLAVALWRHPQEARQHLIVDFSGETKVGKADLEETPAGFWVSPFLNEDGTQTRLVRADFHYHSELDEWPEEEDLPASAARRAFFRTLQEENHRHKAPLPKAEAPTAEATAPGAFQDHVRTAVEAIRAGAFRKVVLARTKTVDLPDDFDVLDTFERLCRQYADAFVSLFYLPGEGVWMSATPEVLLRVDRDQHFHTMALAGTQPVAPDQSLDEVRWAQKEIEEQALVSRYIISCFKRIRLREYEEEGPRTVRAGHLTHLRTDYSVDMQATRFPQLGTVMLELLHPTSAVCGQPKAPALHFIQTREGFDRQFFSGFLGPVHLEGESRLYVHLRCMQLQPGQATLYAGAGITADSRPDREWQETELKCDTLLRVLKGE
ncbi:isochorismate synthase [Catalinimonas alkaloidigena]|uniref:isochorismate synthase n=1 Tax=Catalinimonas alkaloidigena TaxID=1075417 RepID=A0A1G9H2L8_9BACT|nr:isochorismate synthase [Catalinimonas alkaloidigena]SDL06783.1 isochorismate synthase [Catalinimonas alkaloidigena]